MKILLREATNIGGVNARTLRCSRGTWKGKDIWVYDQTNICPLAEHDFVVLYDESNYPIGLLMCGYCGGVADDPDSGDK